MIEFSVEDKKAMIKSSEILIGTPWKSFGRDTAEGLDCYGLVLRIYSSVGINLPDPCKDASDVSLLFAQCTHYQFGDIYHCKAPHGIDHVAIVLWKSEGKPFLVESYRKKGVRFTDLKSHERVVNKELISYYRLKNDLRQTP